MSDTSAEPVTFITGGGSGIGAETARQLLGRGHRVVITGRRGDRLSKLAAELGGPPGLLAIPGDAADHVHVAEAVQACVTAFGRLDAVVASAGYGTFDDLAGGDPAGWRHMVLTNVLGPALLIRAALPELRRAGGRIVLVGSVAGTIYSEGNIYGATKWAVTAMAENTRRMVTGDGVGVALINPGAVATSFWDGNGSVPDRPMLTAGQVAAAIVWALGQPEGVDVNTLTIRPIGAPIA